MFFIILEGFAKHEKHQKSHQNLYQNQCQNRYILSKNELWATLGQVLAASGQLLGASGTFGIDFYQLSNGFEGTCWYIFIVMS